MKTRLFTENPPEFDRNIIQFIEQQSDELSDPCPTVVGLFINNEPYRKIYCDNPQELIRTREYLVDFPELREIKIEYFTRLKGCDFAFELISP
ncbi:hypothetical protein A1D22_09375 [Pasteurellaceae bacterium LFhippo2]|nr:hypothetical protein [Pasteurellaceae bacterium LFhippo2]